jgi:hypothetical protein
MSKEKVVDKNGLPIYEECVFIKVANDNLEPIKEFIKEKNISHFIYNSAASAFCDCEAEFRLRAEFKRQEPETDEIIIKQKSLDAAKEYGDILLDDLQDNGTILNNDHIDSIIDRYFKEDFVSEED